MWIIENSVAFVFLSSLVVAVLTVIGFELDSRKSRKGNKKSTQTPSHLNGHGTQSSD